MDEPTNGESTLRSMRKSSRKRFSNNSINLHLSFKSFCKFIFYSSITICLGSLFIKKGVEPIHISNINIDGQIITRREQIIQAMNLKFPTTILNLNPKQIESSLLKELPIKAVAINRRILPLGLDIKVLERVPIALALRQGKSGKERGMVDKDGYWIPILHEDQGKSQINPLVVDGWTESNKKWIKLIFKYQKKLSINLKRIIFNPNGNITLQTKDFLFVHLGNEPKLLGQQIEAIDHLSKSLPKELMKGSSLTLDLKNPAKPKLFLDDERD